jgi:hypothetical protein
MAAKQKLVAPDPVVETAVSIIPKIKAGAMSKDVGPIVIAGLAQAYADETKGRELITGAQSKTYNLLAQLTQAIVKAAKADTSIKLSVASGTDAKAQGLLNDQIGIALGFRDVITVGSGDKTKQRVTYAKSVAQFFPMPNEDKQSDAYKRKTTMRSNFLHMVKKCELAADAIIQQDMDVKMDKASGSLMLSGPAVKKQFGQASVVLNEKQTVTDSKGNETKLNERPSFTALAAKAKESHGGTIHRGSNTRGDAATQLSNPGQALNALCKSVIEMLARVKNPGPAQITSVKQVESAIDTWLTNWAKD